MITRVFLLPSRSEGMLPINDPPIVPIRAMETVSPCSMGLRFQYNWIACSAPEITAVSNPNRNPPKATTRLQRNTFLFFIWLAIFTQSMEAPLSTSFDTVSIKYIFKKISRSQLIAFKWTFYENILLKSRIRIFNFVTGFFNPVTKRIFVAALEFERDKNLLIFVLYACINVQSTIKAAIV